MSDPASSREHKPRILVVDDDESFRVLLERILRSRYQIALAPSGEAALEVAPEFLPDLVLLDIHMPGIDGYETCRRLRSAKIGKRLQVIMVSAVSSWDEQLRAFHAGADDYVVKPIQAHEFLARVQLHFRLQQTVADVDAVKAQIRTHQSKMTQYAAEEAENLAATQDVAVFALAEIVESRDEGTGQHLLRMRAYSQLLGEQLQASGPYSDRIGRQFLDDLYRSSPLHDIGKVGIPDAILLKPGPLTAEEFVTIQSHTVIGANILDHAVFRSRSGGFLAMAAAVARYHHERWDGTGYPAGLVGEETPLPARIVALADVFDALTSDRPYRKAMSAAQAKAIIMDESGTHFDPVVADVFLRRFSDFIAVQEKLGHREPLVLGAIAVAHPDTVVQMSPYGG